MYSNSTNVGIGDITPDNKLDVEYGVINTGGGIAWPTNPCSPYGKSVVASQSTVGGSSNRQGINSDVNVHQFP